ncbi:MAG: hypothetical protein O9264_16230 [Leptospira sp.]|nr:hypothetical protein [Leptospira sp.]
MKILNLSLAGENYEVYEFVSPGSMENFLRKHTHEFYTERLSIHSLITEKGEFGKFYARFGSITPKLMEDCAVWSLAKLKAKQVLSIDEPEIGKDIQINPMGQDPTKGDGTWQFANYDIDRVLYVKKEFQPISSHVCQVYSPNSLSVDYLKMIKEKNRQLPFLRSTYYDSFLIEIIIFFEKPELFNIDSLSKDIKKFKTQYSNELRWNTFLSFILWGDENIKIYRVRLS